MKLFLTSAAVNVVAATKSETERSGRVDTLAISTMMTFLLSVIANDSMSERVTTTVDALCQHAVIKLALTNPKKTIMLARLQREDT